MAFSTTAVLKLWRLVHETKGCNSNAHWMLGTREAEGARVAEEFAEQTEYIDKIVHVNRVAKVVKGGRRFSFSALVDDLCDSIDVDNFVAKVVNENTEAETSSQFSVLC